MCHCGCKRLCRRHWFRLTLIRWWRWFHFFQGVCCQLMWMGVAHTLLWMRSVYQILQIWEKCTGVRKRSAYCLGREKCCQTSYLLREMVVVKVIRMLHIDIIPLWWDKRSGKVFDYIAHRFRVTSTCQWSRSNRSDMLWVLADDVCFLWQRLMG